MSLMIV